MSSGTGREPCPRHSGGRSVPDHWRGAWGVELVRWVMDTERGLRPEAIEAFLDSADFFLICEALATGSTVVTREVSASGSRRVIKIPDVCSAFDVPCHQPFDVCERLGLRLLV